MPSRARAGDILFCKWKLRRVTGHCSVYTIKNSSERMPQSTSAPPLYLFLRFYDHIDYSRKFVVHNRLALLQYHIPRLQDLKIFFYCRSKYASVTARSILVLWKPVLWRVMGWMFRSMFKHTYHTSSWFYILCLYAQFMLYRACIS